MGFKRITILGVGLMGGSVGMACRESASDLHIIGYGHNSGELDMAVQQGAIHEVATDLTRAVADADLVIFSTPVGSFGQLMTAVAPTLKTGAVVTDVGSTKRSIVRLAEELLPSTVRFVGSHPMVGGEKHGIQNARADLLAGALCIVTANESADSTAVNRVEEFWQKLRMRTVRMTPESHDQLTASISHLPHAIAAALVRVQSPKSLQIAARGFLDATRIAGGDSALWRDIFLDNRDNLKAGIERLQGELQQLLQRLEAGDAEAVQEWLKTAAEARVKIGTAQTK